MLEKGLIWWSHFQPGGDYTGGANVIFGISQLKTVADAKCARNGRAQREQWNPLCQSCFNRILESRKGMVETESWYRSGHSMPHCQIWNFITERNSGWNTDTPPSRLCSQKQRAKLFTSNVWKRVERHSLLLVWGPGVVKTVRRNRKSKDWKQRGGVWPPTVKGILESKMGELSPPGARHHVLWLLGAQQLLTHLCAMCCRWEEERSRREQLESTVESMQQVTSTARTPTFVYSSEVCQIP